MENNEGHHIMENLLAAFNQDTESILALFTPQATVEYPYAKSLALPHKLTMYDYRNHLNSILQKMPEIIFTDLKVHALKEESWYWGEFHAETTVPQTGAVYKQEYVVNFKLDHEKFSIYREFWNILPVLQRLMDKEEAFNIIDNPIR
ncbi:nuclear transport factor 2 family protein [uncultured Chryseobacterium sp.]|uniref:nuclear transport factor 2 family protein n=1 Tax=uncultured Chryseobacterium sp. TaxID=259322 RepID=UPI0025F78468|nr:nuclear transport factor 2 family protein [uncultured Chryseobacterium sp.]